MDAKQLQIEAEKLKANAQSQRQQADRFRNNVPGDTERGDEVAARIDQQRADEFEREAERMERDAETAMGAAADMLQRARQIDKQQADLEANFKREMDELERKKRQLLGGASLLF
jgi:cytochrome c556